MGFLVALSQRELTLTHMHPEHNASVHCGVLQLPQCMQSVHHY